MLSKLLVDCTSDMVVQPVIAFHVSLTSTMRFRKIPFNRVVMNLGNGWNSASHTFTAPTKGLYSFTLSVLTDYSSTSGNMAHAVIIMRGGGYPRYILAQRSPNIKAYIPATGSTVAMLNAGNQVYAYSNGLLLYSNGNAYTNFVGFLIQKVN